MEKWKKKEKRKKREGRERARELGNCLWGKTQNRVMDRFIGHRADMRASLRGEDESKPAYHFKRDTGVVVFEEVKGKDDLYRVTRERFWINCLGMYDKENKRK